VVGEVLGVAADSRQQPRLECVHPVQAKEVQAGPLGDTAMLGWSTALVEDRELDPAEVVV
jgi:hypothetical protein